MGELSLSLPHRCLNRGSLFPTSTLEPKRCHKACLNSCPEGQEDGGSYGNMPISWIPLILSLFPATFFPAHTVFFNL